MPSEVLTSWRFIITFLTLQQLLLFRAEHFMCEHCMIVLETSAFMTKHNHVHPHMIFHLGVLFMLEATYVTLIFRG